MLAQALDIVTTAAILFTVASGLLIVFYQLLIIARPASFRPVDEVEVALEHLANEGLGARDETEAAK